MTSFNHQTSHILRSAQHHNLRKASSDTPGPFPSPLSLGELGDAPRHARTTATHHVGPASTKPKTTKPRLTQPTITQPPMPPFSLFFFGPFYFLYTITAARLTRLSVLPLCLS